MQSPDDRPALPPPPAPPPLTRQTYAIPAISRLLHSTGQFEAHAGKRYDDTDLLLVELTSQPYHSDRAQTYAQPKP